MSPATRTACVQRLIATYGLDAVREMTSDFAHGHTCGAVGARHGVTRQAAGIWRLLLGRDVHTFEVYQDVRAIADESPVRRVG